MTYIETTPPGGPAEIEQPPQTTPEHDPSAIPDEAPQPDPGGGGPGDSRPHDEG